MLYSRVFPQQNVYMFFFFHRFSQCFLCVAPENFSSVSYNCTLLNNALSELIFTGREFRERTLSFFFFFFLLLTLSVAQCRGSCEDVGDLSLSLCMCGCELKCAACGHLTFAVWSRWGCLSGEMLARKKNEAHPEPQCIFMYIYGHGSCPAQYNNIYAMALGNKKEISQYFQDLGLYTVELGIYLLCPNKRVCIKEA